MNKKEKKSMAGDQKPEKETTSLNIYTKLQLIQSEVKELIRTEENKFQKYKFFNELQVLKLLRPLLNKYQLTILLSDDTSQPFIHEKDGKEHFVKYLKRLEIVDCEAIDSSLPRKGQQVDTEISSANLKEQKFENRLLFNFWAAGSNVDLAKAKGSSETYAIKYMLSKFFLIPVKDEGDPDYRQREEKDEMTPEERAKVVNNFLKKHERSWNEEDKEEFKKILAANLRK